MIVPKWGSSLALRITALFAKGFGAAPVRNLPAFDLDTLILGITEANRHDEMGSGPALGAEPG
jgi:antitoxin component of MazEF toxin-antitoxin module